MICIFVCDTITNIKTAEIAEVVMESTVYTKIYAPPPWNRREILRYAGVHGDAPDIEPLLDSCIAEAEKALAYKVCFSVFPLKTEGAELDLGFAKTSSAHLRKNLAECGQTVLFAATVGVGIDRLISRYSKVSPAKALIFQAIGAERIESLCEAFARDVAKECATRNMCARPRFSPGYGDLPLEMQNDIFAALSCPCKIGLTLNASLLMSPTKSVTAIIGIKPV